jgi:hypothetical protein
MTTTEYLKELVDELIDVAVDFGSNPTEENELRLAEVSGMVYNAVEIRQSAKLLINILNQK